MHDFFKEKNKVKSQAEKEEDREALLKRMF